MIASFQSPAEGLDHQVPMPDVPDAGDPADAGRVLRRPRVAGSAVLDPAATDGPAPRRAADLPRGRPAPHHSPGDLDARRRPAARRSRPARGGAGLRERLLAARTRAAGPRHGRGRSSGSGWRAWTTRCGGTARRAPTTGCSTCRTVPADRAPGGWGSDALYTRDGVAGGFGRAGGDAAGARADE